MTTLRIYGCLMIANSTSERTFSKLKFLKNCHRFSMTQERLNSLTIMTVEYDILQNINFQDNLKVFQKKNEKGKYFKKKLCFVYLKM